MIRSALAAIAAPCLIAICLTAPAAFAEKPTRFTATVTGQGPDVILVPGLVSSGAVWDATVKQISTRHRVHVLQVAGFAGLPAGPNAADDQPLLVPLIEEIATYVAGLDHPAMVGHSLGGLAVLEVAAGHPDAVSRIMVVDALPFYPLIYSPTATVEMVKPQAEALAKRLATMTDEQYAASETAVMASLVKAETARAAVVDWAVKSDKAVAARAMYDDMTTDARLDLPKISKPTTILYAFDPIMGAQTDVDDLYAGAYKTLSGAKLVRIDNSYHFIMLDQPAAFAAQIETFLK
jgi:pimeloyl-ACP methyl ester carboxylesterase